MCFLALLAILLRDKAQRLDSGNEKVAHEYTELFLLSAHNDLVLVWMIIELSAQCLCGWKVEPDVPSLFAWFAAATRKRPTTSHNLQGQEMPLVRSHVPPASGALLRALLRPQPRSCPFARARTPLIVRGKRSRAAKVEHPVDFRETARLLKSVTPDLRDAQNDDAPLSDEETMDERRPTISWYEQDMDKGTPRRLISRTATAEDWRRERQTMAMYEESMANRDYDDAPLNRHAIDTLLANPNFADLTEELKDIKADIMSKDELVALEASAEDQEKQLQRRLRMTTRNALQNLVDDPDAGDAGADLRALLDKSPDLEHMDSPEFQADLTSALRKLNENEAFSNKLGALADQQGGAEFENEWSAFERQIDELIAEDEAEDPDLDLDDPDDLPGIDKLLAQMRDLLKATGGDSPLQAELNAALSEDIGADQSRELERTLNMEELAQELETLVQTNVPSKQGLEASEDVSAKLQAKVDKIMEDPKLMDKLAYIGKLIKEAKQAQPAITAIAHETAPDPFDLEDARVTTLKQRMEAAQADPEHSVALSRLRVTLNPPFIIAPALKSFNQAIELAYLGANDDIRRILWRSYQKARTLPTFLQNVSDEAWDILYYSQAVKWKTNQNRQQHLTVLLSDLQSLGREGPPTHPKNLVKKGDNMVMET